MSQDDRGTGGNYAFAAKKPAMEITDELPATAATDLVLNRYRLGQRWSFEAQNATDFSRASLNYRIEK